MYLTTRFVHDPPAFAEERKTVRGPDGKLRVDGVGIALIGLGSAAFGDDARSRRDRRLVRIAFHNMDVRDCSG